MNPTLGEAITSSALITQLAAFRFVKADRYGITPMDPAATVGALALLAGVALVAGVIPARRAARVDPIVALRVE